LHLGPPVRLFAQQKLQVHTEVLELFLLRVPHNGPRVGIFLDGFIWHYSNSQQRVVKELPAQFAQHYAPPDNAMFFGTLP